MKLENFLELDVNEQLLAVAKMTPEEKNALRNELAVWGERLREQNTVQIKFAIARQYANETKDMIRSFRNEQEKGDHEEN